MNDLTTDEAEAWRRGAEAMREHIATHLELLGPVAEGMKISFNPAGWRQTVMDVRHYPTPPPPPDIAADGLSYRGG